jgi:hypothetical protein
MKFESPLQWLPQQPRTKKPTRARFGYHSLSNAGYEIGVIHNLRQLIVGGGENF